MKNQDGDWDFYLPDQTYTYSYFYVGWMLDLLDKPYLPPVEINTYPNLVAGTSALGLPAPAGGFVPQQAGAALDQKLLELMGVVDPGGVNILRVMNGDIELDDVYVGVGNGAGDTIYRLKEGNERFMITDVNNPQTSAMAQSTLFAMMDLFGNTGGIALFNHVPGGCNVLFMDGHVDWIPYVAPAPGTVDTASMDLGATQPVLPSMAGVIGIFNAAL